MTVTVCVYALATLVNTTHVGIILYYVTLTKLTKSNKICHFKYRLLSTPAKIYQNDCEIAHDNNSCCACLGYLEECDTCRNHPILCHIDQLTKSNKLCRFQQGLYLQVFLLNMCKIAHDSDYLCACLDYLEQCDKLINRHNCVTSPKAANSSKKRTFPM
jgi:hypothetical protein